MNENLRNLNFKKLYKTLKKYIDGKALKGKELLYLNARENSDKIFFCVLYLTWSLKLGKVENSVL